MVMQKIHLGNFEDGTPHFHYHCPDGHVVLTGPHTGDVSVSDGTVYNVTEAVIEVASPEHAAQVAALLDTRTMT